MTLELRRVLIIDDEPAIRTLIRANLEAENFQVAEAETGQKGLERAISFHPHLIILDLGLPDQSGLEVMKSLRVWTTIPIIILTVSDEESAKVKLLDAGADDYLTKPFSTPELLARMRVSLRNRQVGEATPLFVSGDLSVDINSGHVKLGSTEIKLTATEFELLKRLVRGNGKVVSQQLLLSEVWGPNSIDQSHYLRIYVAQLRKKIEVEPSKPRHLITEPGIGYRLQ